MRRETIKTKKKGVANGRLGRTRCLNSERLIDFSTTDIVAEVLDAECEGGALNLAVTPRAPVPLVDARAGFPTSKKNAPSGRVRGLLPC